MATYISLINWTDQGIRNFKDTLQRYAQGEEMMGRLGVRIKDVYWTVGPYDIVVIAEADDDEAATAALLELGAQGNVRTATLRAYSRDEMSRIIQRVG